MRDLKTISDYDALFKLVRESVNRIDPCFYSGPEDEYDDNINRLLSLFKDHKINLENFSKQLRTIFYGTLDIGDAENEKLAELSTDLKKTFEIS